MRKMCQGLRRIMLELIFCILAIVYDASRRSCFQSRFRTAERTIEVSEFSNIGSVRPAHTHDEHVDAV